MTRLREGLQGPGGRSALTGYPGLWCLPIDEDLIDRLIARTLDPADGYLRNMTHDLARFSSREQFERWRRDRQFICLSDDERSLLGIVWLGSKPMPARDDYVDPALARGEGPRLTFAIRLYGSVRGDGIAQVFLQQALAELVRDRPDGPSLWFETRAENLAARHLGRRTGFVEVTGEANGTVIGVRLDDPP